MSGEVEQTNTITILQNNFLKYPFLYWSHFYFPNCPGKAQFSRAAWCLILIQLFCSASATQAMVMTSLKHPRSHSSHCCLQGKHLLLWLPSKPLIPLQSPNRQHLFWKTVSHPHTCLSLYSGDFFLVTYFKQHYRFLVKFLFSLKNL